MILLLNIVFALLFGWLALWVTETAGVPRPLSVCVAVVVGIIVFLANLAVQVLQRKPTQAQLNNLAMECTKVAYPIYLLRCECPAVLDKTLVVIKLHQENCPTFAEQ